MSMNWHAAPGREEHALLTAPGRDAAVTAVVVALAAGVFAAVGDHGTLSSVQRLNDAWLRLMISGRALPLTAIAKFFGRLPAQPTPRPAGNYLLSRRKVGCASLTGSATVLHTRDWNRRPPAAATAGAGRDLQ
jgi:hypothetical protein